MMGCDGTLFNAPFFLTSRPCRIKLDAGEWIANAHDGGADKALTLFGWIFPAARA